MPELTSDCGATERVHKQYGECFAGNLTSTDEKASSSDSNVAPDTGGSGAHEHRSMSVDIDPGTHHEQGTSLTVDPRSENVRFGSVADTLGLAGCRRGPRTTIDLCSMSAKVSDCAAGAESVGSSMVTAVGGEGGGVNGGESGGDVGGGADGAATTSTLVLGWYVCVHARTPDPCMLSAWVHCEQLAPALQGRHRRGDATTLCDTLLLHVILFRY